MEPNPIIIFTTPSCPYCHDTMDWLDSRGIPYIEKNADNPAVALEAARLIGLEIEIVPTLIVNGEVIVGPDRRKILKALEKK